MIQSSIEFPEADLKAFWARIQRAAIETGKALGPTLKMAANALARSVGKSTKVAPKQRQVVQISGVKSRSGKQAYEVTSEKGGQRHRFRVYAHGMREAKAARQVKIGHRGLAKATWKSIARQLGKAGESGGATDSAERLATLFGEVDANLRGANPYAILKNKLPYAVDALQDGAAPIDTALARTVAAIDHIVDKQLSTAIAKGKIA